MLSCMTSAAIDPEGFARGIYDLGNYRSRRFLWQQNGGHKGEKGREDVREAPTMTTANKEKEV